MDINKSRSFVTGASPQAEKFILPWSGRGCSYTDQEIAAVVEVMKNADPLTQGVHQDAFEKVFSEYHGGFFTFATSSCAGALELSALLLNLEPGDEVVIPAHTYVASVIPFARHGAKIVWADIDPDFRVVTSETLEKCITRRTKVIVVVHLYGVNAPMEDIMALSEKHGVAVIEDCAQSLGASCNGKKSGTHGHIACYSFHAQKNISTLGEGGMLAVTSPEHAAIIPGLRHNGHRPFPEDREFYWIPAMNNVDFDMDGVWPYNFSLSEAQCALGIELMSRLDEMNNRRYQNARRIIESLADFPELVFQKIPEGSTHAYHLLSAKYNGPQVESNRDELIKILAYTYGIQAIVQYYPLYRYPMFVRAGMGEAACPNTDEFFDNMVSFPFYEWYTEKDLTYLISSIKAALESLRKR